jgi:chemotaxis protein histidine kinase CheA
VSGQLDFYSIDHFSKMKNLKTLNEARHIAEKLLDQAKENEPNITADLQNIALEVSAKIVGLENKFKTIESLTQKLMATANLNSQTIVEASETVNDALRYTFILAVENYVIFFEQTIEILWQSGYYIPENRIWNAWKNIGGKFDKGYRGINISVISSQKQIFELQFHTDKSYELKAEMHNLYKESRKKETSIERRREIKRISIEEAEKIKIPDGVK